MRTGAVDLLTCDESSFLEDSEHVFFVVLHRGKRITDRPVYCKSLLFPPASGGLGSARVSRAGFGVAPKQSFFLFRPQLAEASTNEKFGSRRCSRQDACAHSTVTLLARLRGLSTSRPNSTARWYARS